jgi:hypothetical protein
MPCAPVPWRSGPISYAIFNKFVTRINKKKKLKGRNAEKGARGVLVGYGPRHRRQTVLVGVSRVYTNNCCCASFVADSPASGMVNPHTVGWTSQVRYGNFDDDCAQNCAREEP